MVSLEYHFPLWYADRGLGLILYHMHLLKGSFFIDYGAGWKKDFDVNSWTETARTSVGATLTTQSSALSMFFPFECGIAVGYKTREGDWFTKGVLNFEI